MITRHYHLPSFPQRKLLLVRAAVGPEKGIPIRLNLLLDTGARYTLLPVEIVRAVGCDIHRPLRRIPVMTAQGVIQAPIVEIPWFHCLGQRIEKWPVIAHTLPPESFVDGLLGMDFLTRFQVTIVLDQARSAEIILRVSD